ncbi:hypothetical protein ABI59_22620 [Acidobacteria bacterium Mor1]|nr:hypothetical protein ABI59_22620 [Acidobacteria bacterium Mor1]
MERELEGQALRKIRVHTRDGYIEGELATNESTSTLHYLNVTNSTRSFLPLQPPLTTSQDWFLDDTSLQIAMDSVLFVVELTDYRPPSGDPSAAALYSVSPVRVRIGNYTIDGEVHVPPQGTPVDRLNYERHPFVAITSASVLGPDAQFAAAFVAVNRAYIAGIQEIVEAEVDTAAVSGETTQV